MINKTCTKCNQEKTVEEFHKEKKAKDGYKSMCKVCVQEYNKANKEKHAETSRKWHAANPERAAAKSKAYSEAHPERMAAKDAKRRAAKLNRTPSWLSRADLAQIEVIYSKAQQMTLETGVQYAVDHIVPLQGETVSGLHIPANLQIITASENSRKKNKF